MNLKRLACPVVAFVLSLAGTGCDKSPGAGAGAGGGDCAYKGKAGFCITPPKGTTPKESADKVAFESAPNAKPLPAQVVVVHVEHGVLDTARMQQERSSAKMGADPKKTVIVADVDLAGGKGFYVAQGGGLDIWTTSYVPGPNNTYFRCSASVYEADKVALKDVLDACKTLKAQ